MAAKPRVKVPKKAAVGDIIKIKSLVSHAMESGHRRDSEAMLLHARSSTSLNANSMANWFSPVISNPLSRLTRISNFGPRSWSRVHFRLPGQTMTAQ